MRRCLVLLVGLLVLLFGPLAQAALCDAPFMHNNGKLRLGGEGLLRIQANLEFSQVSQQTEGCEAKVQGDARVSIAGFPASNSHIDYWIAIRGDHMQVLREVNGIREPVENGFNLDLLGVFGYQQGLRGAGQSFPQQNYGVRFDKNIDPVAIHTGVRTVDAKSALETIHGSQQCWPIRYDRKIDSTMVSLKGLKIATPVISGEVTDWYCPNEQFVMRQDSTQNGVPTYIEVLEMH